jgi:hypothetical protein
VFLPPSMADPGRVHAVGSSRLLLLSQTKFAGSALDDKAAVPVMSKFVMSSPDIPACDVAASLVTATGPLGARSAMGLALERHVGTTPKQCGPGEYRPSGEGHAVQQ